MSNAKISSGTFVVTQDITQIDGLAGFKSGTPNNSNVKISGTDLVSSLETNMTLSNISGTLSIAKGGTGQGTAADAIDALTSASSGSLGQVLTTDGTNVSWENIPNQIIAANKMTATTFGVAKLYSNTTVLDANVEPISSDANRTYGLQLNASNQLVVNVPWVDTDVGPVADVTAGTPSASIGAPLKVTPSTGNVVITSQEYNGGSNVGHVPPNGEAGLYLEGTGSWTSPPNNTYQLSAPTTSIGKILLTDLPSGNAGEVTVSGSGGVRITTPQAGTINVDGAYTNDSITVFLDNNNNLGNTQNDTTYVVPLNGTVENTNNTIFSHTLNNTSIPNNWNAYVTAQVPDGSDGVFLINGGYHSFDGQNTNAQMDLWVEYVGGSIPTTLGSISWPTSRPLRNIGSGFVSTTLNGNAGQVGSCIINTNGLDGPIYFRLLFRHSAFTGGTGYPVNGAVNVGGSTINGYEPFLSVTLLS